MPFPELPPPESPMRLPRRALDLRPWLLLPLMEGVGLSLGLLAMLRFA